MIFDFIKSVEKRKLFYLGLIVLFIFITAEFVGYFNLISRIFIIVGLSGSVLIIFGLIWFIHRTNVKPISKLLKMGEVLTQKDCPALKTTVTELTQGNLSVRLSVQANPIPFSKDHEMDKLTQVFNEIVRSLGETAEEFNKLTDTPCLRLCYVGGDSYLQGQRCGEIMGEAIGGRGMVAITTGFFSAAGLELRRKGFQSLLREKYPEVKIVDILENQENPEIAYNIVINWLKSYPNLAGIYVTEGATPPGVAKAIVDGKKVGKVKIIAYDLTDETMHYVKDGVITATIGDDPFAQGHNPAIHIFNHLVNGWTPQVPRLLTQLDVVTPQNYHQFWEPGRGVIQSQATLERLARPVDKASEKPLRIAVLGREDSAFWFPVRDGALRAKEELKSYNTTVEWIVPPEAQERKDFGASVYGKVIESLIEQGYDGIATIAADRELVPYINHAVEKGIPVVTFNSEPSSLRSLVFTITEQAGKLMELSQNLAINTSQVNQSTIYISKAMNDIAQATVLQNEQFNKTREASKALLRNINVVTNEAKESANASAKTAEAVASGTEAMGKTLTSMKTIEKSIRGIWEIVDELSDYSDKIDTIVDVIDDIAAHINVLGLNAVIEAVHAGEYGESFAVVADEVRKLAKDTAQSTKEITNLVNTVKLGIDKVGKAMKEGLDKVKMSASLTDEAVAALSNIRQLVDIDKQRIHKIASSISDMEKFSRQVGESMENVAVLSEENAGRVEEVNSATNEMSAQLKGVAELAKLLEDMAEGEQQLLAKFNLSEDE